MLLRSSPRLGVLVLIGLAFLCGSVVSAQTKAPAADARGGAGRDGVQVPAGTILPIRLNHGFSSKNARVGQPLTGRIMQDVPLSGSGKSRKAPRSLELSYRFPLLEITAPG